MESVLIAHSDLKTAQDLAMVLKTKDLRTAHAPDGAAAMDLLEKQSFIWVLAEQNLPKITGLELIAHTQVHHPSARVVLLSPHNSAQAALSAMRAGAFDFLVVPLDPGKVSECLGRLLNEAQSPAESGPAGTALDRFGHIIGQSKAIREVFRLVDKVADTNSTVMIYGESGTGKELIAQAIHQNSRRSDQPLIPVNCGAIPEELLESELFGHEKGAFTSAIRTRIGRFELADKGTIFLDEIADMSPKLQVKILRVLQSRQFERIGGAKTIEVDIRVITATNKNLRQAMQEGRFREDLFYRLNVIPITVPPLRERRPDIPLLAEHFFARFNTNKNKHMTGVAPEIMTYLLNYSWPGNIRELENIIERMVILAEDDILTLSDLPPRIYDSESRAVSQAVEVTDEGLDFNQVVSDFEDQLLVQALEKTGWVKNKAAKLLKLNRTTLVEKLKKKNIRPPAD